MIEADAQNDVLLAFADTGNWAAAFGHSLMSSMGEDTARDVRRFTEYHDAAGPYIHDNRCRLARYFLEDTDKQWLWMCDTDMEWRPSALYELLDAAVKHECRILSAAYWNAYGKSAAYLSWLAFTPDGIKAIPEIPPGEDPIEVTAVGMGCTLIHREALQDVADMYPGDPWDTFGADILVEFEDGGFMVGRVPDDYESHLDGRMIRRAHRMGEDVTFCLRARRAGHLSYGLPTLVADHYKPHYMVHGRSSAPEPLLRSSKED
jgi:hypothetical protein